MGPDARILVFWMLSFKSTFPLSSFTFIKRLFSFLLSAVSVVSSAYLRLLIFLPAILIPVCVSPSPVFLMVYSAAAAAKSLQSCPTLCDPTAGSPPGSSIHGIFQARVLEWGAIMYSAYKLNKQGDNVQPWCTPFPIWNQSVVPCLVLTVSSWTACRFLRRQVMWSGIPMSWRIFQFVVIHTVKGFAIVNKTEVDVFLEFSCFFYDPTHVGNLISGSCAFSKFSLNIWKFSIHLL